MVVVLSGLGQLGSDVEILVRIESQACCVRGLELFREYILYDQHVVGLHTRDEARAIPLNLKLGHTALAMLRYKHVVSHLEVRGPHMRLVVMLLNSSIAITRSILRHLCVDLGHSLRQLSTSISFYSSIKSRRALTSTLSFNISASGLGYACPVKTCIGVLLFSLVDK
jgi:hypothetical protein